MSYFTAVKIGAALAKARVQAGLSQREMACMIEKNERTVQNWCAGSRGCPAYVRFLLAEHYKLL